MDGEEEEEDGNYLLVVAGGPAEEGWVIGAVGRSVYDKERSTS